MKNTSDRTTKGGLTVQTAIKAGGFNYNHNRGALKVRTAVKASLQAFWYFMRYRPFGRLAPPPEVVCDAHAAKLPDVPASSLVRPAAPPPGAPPSS